VVIVKVSMDAHCLRKQVGIGTESDCSLGQPRRVLEISASDAGWKKEKSGGVVDVTVNVGMQWQMKKTQPVKHITS